jgi:hypothetical protein
VRLICILLFLTYSLGAQTSLFFIKQDSLKFFKPSTFQYKDFIPAQKKSSTFKFTYRVKTNEEEIKGIIQTHSLPDDFKASDIASFNLRVRWKIREQHRIYIGSNGFSQRGVNALYFGYSFTFGKTKTHIDNKLKFHYLYR